MDNDQTITISCICHSTINHNLKFSVTHVSSIYIYSLSSVKHTITFHHVESLYTCIQNWGFSIHLQVTISVFIQSTISKRNPKRPKSPSQYASLSHCALIARDVDDLVIRYLDNCQVRATGLSLFPGSLIRCYCRCFLSLDSAHPRPGSICPLAH